MQACVFGAESVAAAAGADSVQLVIGEVYKLLIKDLLKNCLANTLLEPLELNLSATAPPARPGIPALWTAKSARAAVARAFARAG